MKHRFSAIIESVYINKLRKFIFYFTNLRIFINY